jgi:flagellar hook-basal body complex protein FliE
MALSRELAMRIERTDINQLLQQMRQMQTQLNGTQGGLQEAAAGQGLHAPNAIGGGVGTSEKVQGFGELFQQAIGSVNATQQQAGALATSFEQGDPKVSLAQVMVASQKASVSFQALTQVRNHLVEAYKDIMNMPV